MRGPWRSYCSKMIRYFSFNVTSHRFVSLPWPFLSCWIRLGIELWFDITRSAMPKLRPWVHQKFAILGPARIWDIICKCVRCQMQCDTSLLFSFPFGLFFSSLGIVYIHGPSLRKCLQHMDSPLLRTCSVDFHSASFHDSLAAHTQSSQTHSCLVIRLNTPQPRILGQLFSRRTHTTFWARMVHPKYSWVFHILGFTQLWSFYGSFI